MGIKIEFENERFEGYIGKIVKVVFTDDEEMICKVLGYTSAADTDDGIATVDVSCDKYEAVVEIPENEIVSIDFV